MPYALTPDTIATQGGMRGISETLNPNSNPQTHATQGGMGGAFLATLSPRASQREKHKRFRDFPRPADQRGPPPLSVLSTLAASHGRHSAID